MQWYFAVASRKGWNVIQEKEILTLLPRVNYTQLGCDRKWLSCGCNAANLIKLGYPKYVSLIYSNTFP